MPPAKVVDASVVAALIFAEPKGQELGKSLAGAPLLAPALLPIEICSVYLKKSRLAPQKRGKLWEELQGYHDLDIQLHDLNAVALGMLAEESGLSAYDASYLLLARAFDLELVTLDKQLARAASK